MGTTRPADGIEIYRRAMGGHGFGGGSGLVGSQCRLSHLPTLSYLLVPPSALLQHTRAGYHRMVSCHEGQLIRASNRNPFCSALITALNRCDQLSLPTHPRRQRQRDGITQQVAEVNRLLRPKTSCSIGTHHRREAVHLVSRHPRAHHTPAHTLSKDALHRR